jgi:FkbM family methyltransferase
MNTNFYGQFNPPVDKIIRDYFPDKKTGNCIEVGAVDGISLSNTYHFELNGWNCLCIEPITSYFDTLKLNRKKVLNYAISSTEKDLTDFNLVKLGDNLAAISGLELDKRLIDQHVNMGYKPLVEEIKVSTKRLDWCIENFFNYDVIDFISIDTEGSEMDVLTSFDVNKYNTKLLIIENNFNDLDIENYLNQKGWVKDKRVEVNDFYVKK